jgi:IclR family mhp operon transcriptional activator
MMFLRDLLTMATDDRLLTILRALNTAGPCTVLDLQRETKISRPAIYRVMDNLVLHGYVKRAVNSPRYFLTSKVQSLSSGYREDSWIGDAGSPVLEQLQGEVRWPSSLAIPDQDHMVVCETNRHRSPFVFDRGRVGLQLPMLQSSLGLAYLAHCERKLRATTLGLLRNSDLPGNAISKDQRATERLLRNTIQRGYAFRVGGIEPRTSSIAVPIFSGGEVKGAICITFATSTLTIKQASVQFLEVLHFAAGQIAKSAGKVECGTGRN